MSQQSFTPILHCLRRGASASRPGEASDRELLERYLRESDPGAFGAILARHGQRVFATCRRVLHRDADVEDAFQATFLVLLDKARSVRWEPSLGGWLTAVAHRVAVRTRCQAAKQASREAQCDMPEPTARPSDELLWREACAVLHEELDRLPDEFRLPLVLCYVEGLSRDEAAQSLGCSTDTVKGRLERGRARLRGRLERRGVSLSAGLLGACGSTGAEGAPAPDLIHATLRAVTAGKLSAPVGTLGATFLMRNKLKLLAVTVMTVGLVSAAGLWLCAAPSPTGLPRGGTDRVAEAAPEEADEPIVVTGRVLGVDGKPAAGAKLYVHHLKKEVPTSPDDIGAKEAGTAGPDGTFRVPVKIEPRFNRGYLIAHAPGAGVDFLEVNDKTPTKDVTFRLVKDEPITGKVVDTEGKPVVGVTLGVQAIYVPAEEKLDDYLAGWKKDWRETAGTPRKRLYLSLDGITGTSTTDKDGKFRLSGAGAERIAHVSIRGGGAANSVPYVITRSAFDARAHNEAATAQTPPELRIPGQPPTLFGPEFTFVVVLGRAVEGTITDAVTKKPVAGVSVMVHSGFGNGVMGRTDKDGRYRLEGLPQQKSYSVFATPTEGTAYLRRHTTTGAEPGTKPIRLDMEMYKGVMVSGQVIDKQTGRGVMAGIRFAPLPDNKFFAKPGFDGYKGDHTMASTDKDGRFTVATIPGRSVLMAQVHSGETIDGQHLNPYRPAQPEAEHKNLFRYDKDDGWMFTTASGGLEFLGIEHAVKVVDLKEDGGAVKVELFADRARTGKIDVRDGEGKPLTGVIVSGISGGWPTAYKLSGSTSTVYALDPEQPRRLMLLHLEKKIGGSVTVRGDEKEPVVVRLVPLGTVKGRFVEVDGGPLAGADISLNFQDRIGSELYRFMDLKGVGARTDKEGHFTLTGVVPGVKFGLQTRTGDTYYAGEPRIGQIEVEPGKTLDLGERKLKAQR